MDWVKLTTDYYDDVAIALGDDAAEVMFTRGIALAGKIEQHGFIPDAMLSRLTRKSTLAQARKVAAGLVKAGLWDRVRGGYEIVNFESINAELEKLVAKKKREAERKRADRAASRAASEDASADAGADSPAPRPEDRLYESERESKKAAAAASDAAAAALDVRGLPVPIKILKSKLQAHTPLRGLRFDSLNDDQATRLLTLLEVHGDDPLVAVAVATCRNPAPTSAAAFLGTWEALPPPGKPLHVVRQRLCDTHQTVLSPSGTCNACASEQIASDR